MESHGEVIIAVVAGFLLSQPITQLNPIQNSNYDPH